MKTLLIFDAHIDIEYIDKIKKDNISHLTLFALTSNALIINTLQKQLQSTPLTLHIIESAKCINEEVKIMQKTIHQWSSSLGNSLVNNKKLKEWFLLPDKNVSSWWFGLLSEKNTTHDNVFLKIAQINAIKKVLAQHHYEACLVAIADKKQNKICTDLLKNMHIPYRTIKTYNKNRRINLTLFKSLSILLKWLLYSQFIKLKLSPLKKRLPENNPLLFISYFPHVEAEAAKKGVLRNKYAAALQEKLHTLNIPITWIMMPVSYNDYNLQTAIDLAKVFSDAGERLLVLYEFFNVKILLKSVYWWFRYIIISKYVYRIVDKKQLTEKLTTRECLPFIKYLWDHSFSGPSGMRGILFYLTYKALFKKIPNAKQCLYYCEMQAWEKALNAAKKLNSPQTKTLAFQHTIVMRNLFNYFYDPSETIQTNNPTDLPLPDLMIANGNLMQSLLAESKYPELCEAEAIRQLYVKKTLEKPMQKRLPSTLLVACSFDPNETKSLISMIYSAFPRVTNFEIWFKGYPYTPVDKLFLELKIDISKTGYKIVFGDISMLLEDAAVVFVSGSAVAVEAIAHRCSVIVPMFADIMQLNPLVDSHADYTLVSSASELKSALEKEISATNHVRDPTSFLSRYWNLDSELLLWETILTT